MTRCTSGQTAFLKGIFCAEAVVQDVLFSCKWRLHLWFKDVRSLLVRTRDQRMERSRQPRESATRSPTTRGLRARIQVRKAYQGYQFLARGLHVLRWVQGSGREWVVLAEEAWDHLIHTLSRATTVTALATLWKAPAFGGSPRISLEAAGERPRRGFVRAPHDRSSGAFHCGGLFAHWP